MDSEWRSLRDPRGEVREVREVRGSRAVASRVTGRVSRHEVPTWTSWTWRAARHCTLQPSLVTRTRLGRSGTLQMLGEEAKIR